MSAFISALWAEALKARRSKIFWLIAAGISILPLVDGFFMIILKDPEQARQLGLIGAKAQLTAGTADWPTFFYVLLLGTAAGGTILFAFITAWVFGREFSDHTAKEWMALPTRRETIIAAKFLLVAVWVFLITVWIFLLGLLVANAVDIPGNYPGLAASSFRLLLVICLLDFMLLPFVALFASAGRGYLPPLGWAFLTLAAAQVISILGWGDWFPWAVPGMVGELAGPRGSSVGIHSYLLVMLAFIAGVAGTFAWWLKADQTR
jgi:ABC-2 type transport system permease protein